VPTYGNEDKSNVINIMDALKKSIAQGPNPKSRMITTLLERTKTLNPNWGLA
jgi:non-homologous end joining protein Ku